MNWICSCSNLTSGTHVYASRCTEYAWNGEGGCEGGRGGDGGGGDPVEEEPSFPLLVHIRARLQLLHRFSFNFPVESWRLNCSFGLHPIQGYCSPFPPYTGDRGSGRGSITDGSSLQGWGGRTRADKKQFGLPSHLLRKPETSLSVLSNNKWKLKITYTVLPKKATIRMIWFILWAVWHWLNQIETSLYTRIREISDDKHCI